MELEHELNREQTENAGGNVEEIQLEFAGLTASQIAAIDEAASLAERSDKATDKALRLCKIETQDQLFVLEDKFAADGLLPTNTAGKTLRARSLFAKGGAWKAEDPEEVEDGTRRRIIKFGKNNRVLDEADFNVALFCARAEQRLFNRSRAQKDPDAPDWGKGAIFDRLQLVEKLVNRAMPDDEDPAIREMFAAGRKALKELKDHFEPKR